MSKVISSLASGQIEAINAFLHANNKLQFDKGQLAFLANIDTADALGLADCVSFLRGRFDCTSGDGCIGLNAEGVSAEDAYKAYVTTLDAEDYDDSDYQKLLADFYAQATAETAAHGLTLHNAVNASTDVLYLNSNFEPLFIEFFGSC
jgi:hypothetical protein